MARNHFKWIARQLPISTSGFSEYPFPHSFFSAVPYHKLSVTIPIISSVAPQEAPRIFRTHLPDKAYYSWFFRRVDSILFFLFKAVEFAKIFSSSSIFRPIPAFPFSQYIYDRFPLSSQKMAFKNVFSTYQNKCFLRFQDISLMSGTSIFLLRRLCFLLDKSCRLHIFGWRT